jgi:hypothetical protein
MHPSLKKIARAQKGDSRFLTLLGDYADLHCSFLNVKHSIRRLSLRKNGLFGGHTDEPSYRFQNSLKRPEDQKVWLLSGQLAVVLTIDDPMTYEAPECPVGIHS